jgi:hypothetical protein
MGLSIGLLMNLLQSPLLMRCLSSLGSLPTNLAYLVPPLSLYRWWCFCS